MNDRSENKRMTVEVSSSSQWKPKANPWLIAATVALAAFMEVLDTSIANVALPHMQATLAPAPVRGPGFSPAIWSPSQSFCQLAHGRRVSSVGETSFCFASLSSLQRVFFVE
jgi:hypothetical protein